MATIVVADDDPGVRHALALLLRSAGHHAIEADGCHAAVRTTGIAQPAVVVTDLNMPGMPVARLIERLRTDHPDVGVIGVSGGGMHQDPASAVDAALAAGADRALQKPVTNADLLAAVDALVPG